MSIREIVQEHSDKISISLVLFIIAVIVGCFVYIKVQKRKDNLLSHRGIIEMTPSLVSTLGVLGTFAGITLGLYFFDTKDLTHSIPLLLNGLKTAFFTSLAGMIGSLILSGQVNKLFDEKTGGISDSQEAANLINKELLSLKDSHESQAKKQSQFYEFIEQRLNDWTPIVNSIKDHVAVMESRQSGIYTTASDLLNKSANIDIKMGDLLTSSAATATAAGVMAAEAKVIKEKEVSIESKAESMLISIGNIEDTEKGILSKTTENVNHIGEIQEHTEMIVNGQDEIAKHVSTFGDKLHGEIVEIEDKMTETNKLLTEKFEEFAELLKKSNTEALVEVMKKVTEEFQKQMNALINKLIQENFDQLNKSVERLNTWQQENKEMIQSLTSQYKQMAENFEDTSVSLTKVDEDTRQLVSEGGKLRQIVDALNQVIVEDEKFIKISSDLQNTAELTKTNYEQFDDATKKLNDWVKKQRNFVDGVMVLIQKLDDLNKIRDYGEQFWQETRKGMNEGVNIIKGGSDSLNRQVSGLNNQFYARLSTTLAQLDNCIQALVTKAENR